MKKLIVIPIEFSQYNIEKIFYSNVKKILTIYSIRNSVSILLSRLKSQDNSKAVRRGSLEDKEIKDGDDNAL